MAKDHRLHYRALANFSKGQVWQKDLKPELEKIRDNAALSEALPETISEAAFRDIARSTTIKVINNIIRLVERAESNVK